MRTKLTICVLCGLILAAWTYIACQQDAANGLGDHTSKEVMVEFAAIFFCIGAVGGAIVLFGIPWIWRGFLSCTRQLSKAVRGKEE